MRTLRSAVALVRSAFVRSADSSLSRAVLVSMCVMCIGLSMLEVLSGRIVIKEPVAAMLLALQYATLIVMVIRPLIGALGVMVCHFIVIVTPYAFPATTIFAAVGQS